MGGVRPVAAVSIFGTPVDYGDLITAAVVVLVSFAGALLLRRAIMRYSARQHDAHRAAWYAVSRVSTYVIVVFGALLAVGALGVPLSRFEILAGGLGVGLGFGLQTIFSNFVSGLILLFDKSLKLGDFVELESGVTGEVREIRIRATQVVTNDNIDILVPNSEFVSGRVVNWTHREVLRRLRVPFGVAYGTDKDVVKRAALEAAADVPFTLLADEHRRPQVWLTGFGDSSLDFELVVWLTPEAIKKPLPVTAAYNWALHTALQRHGIEIPFPQRDINVRQLFGLSGEDARAALHLAEADTGRRPPAAETRAPSRNDAADEVTRDVSRDVAGDVTGEAGPPAVPSGARRDQDGGAR